MAITSIDKAAAVAAVTDGFKVIDLDTGLPAVGAEFDTDSHLGQLKSTLLRLVLSDEGDTTLGSNAEQLFQGLTAFVTAFTDTP